jgi:hypothetical protein
MQLARIIGTVRASVVQSASLRQAGSCVFMADISGVPLHAVCAGEGPQSLLVLDNVVRIRTACAHNEPGLVTSLSSISRRDPVTIANSSKEETQVKLLPSYRFRGKPYYGEPLSGQHR